jgi:hypothetical protein
MSRDGEMKEGSATKRSGLTRNGRLFIRQRSNPDAKPDGQDQTVIDRPAKSGL